MRQDGLKTSNSRIKISILARHRLVRDSLKSLFESNADIKVEASGDLKLIDKAAIVGTDVAVIYLEAGDPVEAIADLRASNSVVKMVVVTAGEDLDTQTLALRSGAVGIVRADQSAKLLIEAIRQASKGETWLNQALLSRLLEDKGSGNNKQTNGTKGTKPEALTPREVEVIGMIGKGLKSKVIARELLISEATVRHHLSSIYGKLGVDDRLNLVIYAYEKGLIQLPIEPH